MPATQLFLSCVSAEFRSYRETLRHDLDRPNVTVKVQEDFTAFGTETLNKLDAYIQHCDAVVHIVGDMFGAHAGQSAVDALIRTHPDISERLPPLKSVLVETAAGMSYTQWEAWLALYHGKSLLIACPTPGAPRDEDYVDEPAQRATQEAHLARLASIHRYPEIQFANADRLAVDVLRSPLGPSSSIPSTRIYELPLRNPNFSGREGWLETVRATLGQNKPVVVAQAIVGLGGIGKTQLALEFAHRQSNEYDIVWWVRAESLALRDEDLLALHARMELPTREGEPTRERLATLRRALEATARWLLIFDNVEKPEILQDILPRTGGGHVLVTSRIRDWQAIAVEVPLPVWSSGESLQYLAQRTGQPADASLQSIATALGHLPLALEQAAAYMVQAGIGATKYLSLLHRARLEPLGVQGASAIATIWDVSIRAVRARSQDALALLEFLAFMPPDDISRAVLLGRSGIPMPARLTRALRDEMSLNDAVAVLRSFSLVDAAQDRLQIHRLVQLVVSHRLKAKDYRAYAETARRFQPGWVLESTSSSRPPSRRQLQAAAALVVTALFGFGLANYISSDKIQPPRPQPRDPGKELPNGTLAVLPPKPSASANISSALIEVPKSKVGSTTTSACSIEGPVPGHLKLVRLRVPSAYKSNEVPAALPSKFAMLEVSAAEALVSLCNDVRSTGGQMKFSSMFVSASDQLQRNQDYAAGRRKSFAGLPGTSMHEAGRAIDIDLSALGMSLEKFWGMARKRGWHPIIENPDPGKSEAWHFEYIDSQIMARIKLEGRKKVTAEIIADITNGGSAK